MLDVFWENENNRFDLQIQTYIVFPNQHPRSLCSICLINCVFCSRFLDSKSSRQSLAILVIITHSNNYYHHYNKNSMKYVMRQTCHRTNKGCNNSLLSKQVASRYPALTVETRQGWISIALLQSMPFISETSKYSPNIATERASRYKAAIVATIDTDHVIGGNATDAIWHTELCYRASW